MRDNSVEEHDTKMDSQGEVLVFFTKIQDLCRDALKTVQALLENDSVIDQHSKGVSFLEVKNDVLLAYMIDVSLLMQRKVCGKSIQRHPALQRLVENRVILEKMRPIDQKLKYQIDKLVKIAKTGVMDASDPLRFRPNPDDLAAKFENEDSDEEDNEDQSKKSDSVYKAPKVAPVHYAGDETQKERQEKEMEKLKRRALSSTMIQEIRRDFLDEPEEVIESRDLHRVREDRKRKERTQFEEAYFTRVTVSKKDKEKSRRMSTMSSLDGVVKFDDLSYLDQEGDQVDLPVKKRKASKKLMGKKKKGKGGKKKWKSH